MSQRGVFIRLLRLLRRRVCQRLPQGPALGRPRVGALPIEAIEATRLPAITPGPCTRAPAGRRPLVALVRLIELGEVVVYAAGESRGMG